MLVISVISLWTRISECPSRTAAVQQYYGAGQSDLGHSLISSHCYIAQRLYTRTNSASILYIITA